MGAQFAPLSLLEGGFVFAPRRAWGDDARCPGSALLLSIGRVGLRVRVVW